MPPVNRTMKETLGMVIGDICIGGEFVCSDILTKLAYSSKGKKKRGASARQIAALLARRDDLQLIDRNKGIWKKVKEEST